MNVEFHLKSIIGPATKLHDAGLLVEGEVFHVHLTGAVVDGRGLPLNFPCVKQSGLGSEGHLEVPIGTGIVDYILYHCTIIINRNVGKDFDYLQLKS